MGMLLRIVIGFFISVFFVFLIFTSFFSNPQYVEEPSIIIPEHLLSLSDIPESSINTLTPYEYIIGSGTLPNISQTSSGALIQVPTSARMLSSLRNISANYTFTGTGYTVEQEGVGEVFFDTLTYAGKTAVYAINTPLKIQIVNPATGEVYTDIFLDPHMYLIFDPTRGASLKNADAVRIQTVYKLGYISSLDELAEKNSFFSAAYSYVGSYDTQLRKNMDTIENSDIASIGGKQWIERYTRLFVNEQKKKILYKNSILERLFSLARSQKYSLSDIQALNREYIVLKKLDESSYQELKSLESSILYTLYATVSNTTIVPKVSYGNISIEQKDISNWYFPLYSFSLFGLRDTNSTIGVQTQQKFLESFPIFVSSKPEPQSVQQLRYEYFGFLLNNELLYNLQQTDSIGQIDLIAHLLENYIATANIAFSYGDASQHITSLFIYTTLLGELQTYLRSQAFLPDRTSEGLLQVNKKRFSLDDLQLLKQGTTAIFDTYTNDKKYLDFENSRDKQIALVFTKAQGELNEYYHALENYESYASEYDTTKQLIRGIEVYGTNTEGDADITSDDIKKYLSQFEGLDTSNVNITSDNNQVFTVTDLYISGRKFAFDIIPSQSYLIQNIVKDDTLLRYNYKLDLIASDWEELSKKADIDSKDLYDFSKFFIITFFSSSNGNSGEEYIVETNTTQEDKSEIVFKRDKLVGGEFTSITNIAPIAYENIRLEKNTDGYDIFLENIPLSVPSQSNPQFKARLNSEYILNATTHTFTNIDIDLFQDRSYTGELSPLFPNASVHIIGTLPIQNFSTDMQKLLGDIEYMYSVYNTLNSKFPGSPLTIQYTLRNKKMTFKFDSGEKKYTILVDGDSIEKVYEGTKNLIDTPINISELSRVLQ